MIVLGIDPGTAALGYGVVERTGSHLRAVDFGCVTTSPDMSLPERLLIIHAAITEVIATQLRRFGSTVDDLYRVFAEAGYEPCVYDVASNRLLPAPEPIKGNVIFVATEKRGEVERRLGIA